MKAPATPTGQKNTVRKKKSSQLWPLRRALAAAQKARTSRTATPTNPATSHVNQISAGTAGTLLGGVGRPPRPAATLGGVMPASTRTEPPEGTGGARRAALVEVRLATGPWALTVAPAPGSDGPTVVAGPVGVRPGPPAPAAAALASCADPPWTGWRWAAEVAEVTGGDLRRAVLHPEGRPDDSVTVTVAPADEGTVAVEVVSAGAAALAQCFTAAPGERFLGFGERSHAHCLERAVVEHYVGEGPYQPHEYPFLGDMVPPWGLRQRLDATYFPMPWVLSTRGYGVLVDNTELSYTRLRTEHDDTWSVEVAADRLGYRLFWGPTPLDALARMTAAAGRQPAPERWFFGPWFQTGHDNHVPLEEERRQLELLAGTASSAAETHCRYLPVGEDRGHEDAERARTAQFHAAGKAVLSYLNPLVSRDYPEAFDAAAGAGALQQRRGGGDYVFRAYAGGRQPPHTEEAQYDFTAPAGVACWGAVAERLVAAGYDGWMEDFGEYTPLDAVQSDGSSGTAAHNRYPTDYHAAAAEVADGLEGRTGRRLARFVRSGFTGTAAVAPIVWGGDPTTSWGFDGLKSALTEGLSMGASGVAVWGSDTGGFCSTEDRLTPELLRRWIQFSAFCPVMRTKSQGIEIPPYRRPQIWDDEVRPTWDRYARWHLALNDYLMAAADTYRRTGRPIMCALELEHPDLTCDDQYLLGPDLLVAPVLEPGATARSVLLPEGRWIDLFDASRALEGPGRVEEAVGPDDICVYARGGSVVALLPDDVDSLSPYAPAPPDRRTLLVNPGGDWSGPLGPGITATLEDAGGALTLELDAPRPFTFEVRVALRGTADTRRDGPLGGDGGAFVATVEDHARFTVGGVSAAPGITTTGDGGR